MSKRPVATLTHVKAPVSGVHQVTFSELAGWFKEPAIGAKKGLGWLPVDIDLGSRTQERVKSVSFLVLDIEAKADPVKDENGKPQLDKHGDIIKRITGPEPMSFDEMQAELSLLGWHSFLHTSYSHTAEHPRYRLVIDTSRPITASEIKDLGKHVAWLLGIADCLDSGSLESARLFFTPRCPEERKPLYRHAVIDGNPLDVDVLLAEADKINQALKTAQTAQRASRGRNTGNVIGQYNAAYDPGNIIEERGYERKGRGRWLFHESTTGMPGVRLLPDSTPARIYSSHAGDPLNDGKAHDAFDCFCILVHGGDMTAAVRDAARILGIDGAISPALQACEGSAPAGASAPDRGDIHPRFSAPPITPEEMAAARSSPDRIVDNLFYADVGTLIAPGGAGKTTLIISIAAHIVLGRDVLGERVRKPGPVLIVTAEDSREILVARLRNIVEEMALSDLERKAVLEGVRIADVSGVGFKLTVVAGDVVLPSANVDAVIDAAKEIKPVIVVIDPAVSFGVGESRVNDAEQGLVEAARRLRNACNCCVLYVHHTGKANARDKTVDAYSGRGGSAFADGSRMVLVLQSMDPGEWLRITGREYEVGETGLIMARPKMSYCMLPGDIYISRRGYQYERISPAAVDGAAETEARANQLWQWLSEELKHGRKHSKQTATDELISAGYMKRQQIRAALSRLESSGRIEQRSRNETGRGGAHQYLHPVASPETDGEPITENDQICEVGSPEEMHDIGSPPYRETKRRRGNPPSLYLGSQGSPEIDGEAMARLARQSDNEPVEVDI